MNRKVSIFGLGYVGSVTAACLAHKGHDVLGVDLNPDKVEILEAGHSPIVEAGMEDLVASGRQACRLHATTDAAQVGVSRQLVTWKSQGLVRRVTPLWAIDGIALTATADGTRPTALTREDPASFPYSCRAVAWTRT